MASATLQQVMTAVNSGHARNNVPESIKAKLGTGLLHREKHPICTIKNAVAKAFTQLPHAEQGIKRPVFRLFDDESPVVTVKQNFDDLLTPAEHVSRQPSDTFYVDDDRLLRCHTSAHQTEKLRQGETAFLVAADCFRRDEIDSTHYPVFHQMEGVRIFEPESLPTGVSGHPDDPETVRYVCDDLKASLQCMVDELFGESECRWNADSFPFTDPSFELEIKYGGEWLELLGCGMVHRDILQSCGMGDRVGWAFGIGLERVAMARFGIPDIRLFWTDDDRFHSQFDGSMASSFTPYSKYPPCIKDVAFWLSEGLHQHDIFECIRESAGDLVEEVRLIDEFTHPKQGRTSHCYRITYRSMDRNLTNDEINALQQRVRDDLVSHLEVELR